MAISVNIPYKKNTISIDLPFSTNLDIGVKIDSMSNEITVGVKDFPQFIKTFLEANLALVTVQIGLNMLSQRLIVNTDPLIVANMDSMTLGALDIDQDKDYYSV